MSGVSIPWHLRRLNQLLARYFKEKRLIFVLQRSSSRRPCSIDLVILEFFAKHKDLVLFKNIIKTVSEVNEFKLSFAILKLVQGYCS